jgi:hypothetical protein
MEAKETRPEQRQPQIADDHGHDHHKDKSCHHRPPHHIHELENKIRHLLDALAHLGRGTHLKELLRIVRWPGWTTPAELAYVHAILEHIGADVRALERLQCDLVEASWKVSCKKKDHHDDCHDHHDD